MFLVFRDFATFFDDLGEYLFYSGRVPVLCLGDCIFAMYGCIYIWWYCILWVIVVGLHTVGVRCIGCTCFVSVANGYTSVDNMYIYAWD